ncbi:MAG: hypothetical protein AB8B57_15135 [Congregibacter sp.]
MPPTVPPVGDVALVQASALLPSLDIAVAVFDQGLSKSDDDRLRVFPTVRKAESLLLPVALAEALKNSGAWGVVRVVHSPDVYMPLILEGEILRADGVQLELQIRLRSADGEVLLDKVYRDEASAQDYAASTGEDAFADIYRAIANDVLLKTSVLSEQRRQMLSRLALMRFAADVSPASFERFLDRAPDGRFELRSFPAGGDPMLRRLDRIRRQDELFIDTVDQQYLDLRDEVSESYALWRRYSFELERFGDDYIAGAASRKSSARRGSFAAMQQDYARYRKVKVQEDDLGDLVTGFAGDSLETILEVDDGVFRLSGSVSERYGEWRKILARIYDLETGKLDDASR